MSYPYPYKVERNLWASFSLFRPESGQILQTPSGDYRVLTSLPGKHCSTGLMMEHPELGTSEVPSGWFWYGVKVGEDGEGSDAISEYALEDWKAFNQ